MTKHSQPPPDAEIALHALKKIDPNLRRWLEAGAPPIHSENEHIRWFGESYDTYIRRMKEKKK